MEFVLNGLRYEEPGVAPPASPAAPSPALLPSPDSFYAGKVFRSFLNGIFIEFEDAAGNTRLARAVPGKMYLNGRRNLLTLLRSSSMPAMFLPTGTPVRLRVAAAAKSEELLFLSDEAGVDSVTLVEPNKARHDAVRRLLRQAKEKVQRTCGFVAVQVWSEPCPWSPAALDRDPSAFRVEEQEAERLMASVQRRALGDEGVVIEPARARWFMVSHLGPEARSEPRWPTDNDGVLVQGIVMEIQRPHGGIISVGVECKMEQIYFHRSRFLVDGSPLGFTDELDHYVAVGDRVSARVVSNTQQGSLPVVDNCPTANVALWVYKGSTERTPQRVPVELPARYKETMRLKIVELLDDGRTGRMVEGVGLVCPLSQGLAASDPAQAKAVGSLAYFKGRDLTCFGFQVDSQVDLAHLFNIGDELYCKLEELSKEDAAAVGRGCTYRASFGTFFKIESSNTALGSWPRMMPSSMFSFQNFSRRGLCFEQVEKALLGRLPPLRQMLASQCAGTNLAEAVVTGFDQSKDPGHPLSGGKLTLVTGELKGMVLSFDRSVCEVFGMPMAHADLARTVFPFDNVLADVSQVGKGSAVCPRVVLGRRRVFATAEPCAMSEEMRLDAITWLQTRGLSMEALIHSLNPAEIRPFLPFPGEVLSGKVTDINVGTGPGTGNTCGIILVDQGFEALKEPIKGKVLHSMSGQAVFFDRSALYAFGHRLAVADISYILSNKQKVLLEATPITDADRSARPEIPERVRYQASLVWLGPSRPRNDKDRDPSKNDECIKDWLLKRNMSMGKFQDLLGGKLPPNPKLPRDKQGFAIPEEKPKSLGDLAPKSLMGPPSRCGGGGLPSLMAGVPGPMPPVRPPFPMAMPDMQLAGPPVLRHGQDVAHMIETAIMATGPGDVALMNLIEDDAMAQKAHHVAKALQFAIDFYKEKRGMVAMSRKPFGGMPGAFGGGPLPAKRMAVGDVGNGHHAAAPPVFGDGGAAGSQASSARGDSGGVAKTPDLSWDTLFKKS